MSRQLGSSFDEHRAGEIQGHDATPEARSSDELQAHIEGSGADIQYRMRAGLLEWAEGVHSLSPPSSIDVQTQEMVQEIVPGGDLRKDGAKLPTPPPLPDRGRYLVSSP